MSDLPTAQVDPDAPIFHDSADDSAWHVLDGLNDGSQEHAGLILQHPDGGYTYTHPMSNSQHDHFAFRAALQKGWKIAGIYHTHDGTDADAGVFSPDDLAMANKLGVPSYIKFLKDGAVRKYTPGQTPTQNKSAVGSKFSMKVSPGDPLPQDQVLKWRLESLRQKAAQQLATLPPTE